MDHVPVVPGAARPRLLDRPPHAHPRPERGGVARRLAQQRRVRQQPLAPPHGAGRVALPIVRQRVAERERRGELHQIPGGVHSTREAL